MLSFISVDAHIVFVIVMVVVVVAALGVDGLLLGIASVKHLI